MERWTVGRRGEDSVGVCRRPAVFMRHDFGITWFINKNNNFQEDDGFVIGAKICSNTFRMDSCNICGRVISFDNEKRLMNSFKRSFASSKVEIRTLISS